MQQNVVPYFDGIVRSLVELHWDAFIVRLSTERWRFTVTVSHIILPNGVVLRGGMPKIFVTSKNAGFFGMGEVRQAYIATNPLALQKVTVTPKRVEKEENGDVAIFFEGSPGACAPAGVQKQQWVQDPKNPHRVIALPDVKVCPTVPTVYEKPSDVPKEQYLIPPDDKCCQ